VVEQVHERRIGAPAGAADGSARNRRNAIARYRIIDTAAERDFDNIVKLAAQIFDVAHAAISFVLEDRQWFKAQHGLAFCETPVEHSFCVHALGYPDIFWISDAKKNPDFANNPLVIGPPGVSFYAGMRVLANDGTPIATLCVFDPAPRGAGPTEAEQLTLKVLASQVQSLLELRRALIAQRHLAARRAAMTRKVRRMADRDDLTDLPRRRLFRKRLAAAIDEAQRMQTRVAVFLIDVDHFKMINDSLGHDAGDTLLVAFAKRLRASIRKSDLIARLGGDEFGVIVSDIDSLARIKPMIDSLLSRLHRPFRHRDRMIDCQASMGVAIYPDHADTVDGLIKCSDLALATAKTARGGAEIFDEKMSESYASETRMLALARVGVANREMLPHYQLKLDLQTGALAGFEALVRYQRPNEPALLPEKFSHAFSDQKLAVEIGKQMLEHVLNDMRDWSDRNIAFGHVAINSSAADFRADDFAERLLTALDRRALSPALIELEVTEGVFLGREAHHVARALTLLNQHGVRIALDDFGTGFASLTHLKQFPVDVIKIDQSFIGGIGIDPDDTVIVRALIGLGKSLGIKTVAEGVETAMQSQFVRQHGCNFGQGFLYGDAVPAREVPTLIDNRSRIEYFIRNQGDKHHGQRSPNDDLLHQHLPYQPDRSAIGSR
jgi:diguanylate cyclase (GGDEF)-like protein